MNHLTLYAYEEGGELFVYRCPLPECGSTGPKGSCCLHDAPMVDGYKGGDAVPRKPVQVPRVGELDVVVEELKRRQARARADANLGKNLGGWFAGNFYGPGEAIVLLRDHFTRQPAGIGADEECFTCGSEVSDQRCPNSKRPCGHHCNCSWIHDRCHWCAKEFGEETVSADPDGNQQPQGGDAHAEKRRNDHRSAKSTVVAEGDSVQCDGVALAQHKSQREFRIVGTGSSGVERVLANPSTDDEWIDGAYTFLASGDTYRDVRVQSREIATTHTPWRDDCDCDPDGKLAPECRRNGCRSARPLTRQSSGGQEEITEFLSNGEKNATKAGGQEGEEEELAVEARHRLAEIIWLDGGYDRELVEGCLHPEHGWITLRLGDVFGEDYRWPDNKMTVCRVCAVPRCGDSEPDGCDLPRHHTEDHCAPSGETWPVGGSRALGSGEGR